MGSGSSCTCVQELKLELITWLALLDDQETLDALKIIKDSRSNVDDDLSDYNKRAIDEGLRDIEEGRVISREDFNRKYGV